MRLACIICLTFLITAAVRGQNPFNNALIARIEEKNLPEEFTVLVQGDIGKIGKAGSPVKLNYYSGNIASVTTNLSGLSHLIASGAVSYAEFIEPELQIMNDTMLVRNRIAGVKGGAAPLAQAYNGSGVLVGIIDTGVDWQHPDFKDASGNTRIQFIWDQNATSGSTVPQPYNYGVEWTAAQINASVCTHNDLANYGHGTHVTGIAAGNGNATGTHEGCASEADIVVVSVKFNQPGPKFADAVQYIFSKATQLGKPCVINASVGGYLGSHDGTDLEAKLIENMVKNVPGRVLVAAGGNAGHIKYHVKTQPTVTDTTFTWLRKNGTSNIFYYSYADTAQIKNVTIGVGANRSNFSDLGMTGLKPWNYGLSSTQNDTLKHNGNRIGIIKTSASINSYGVYELLIRIYPDSASLFWRVESKGSGLYHSWNFDLVSSNLPTAAQHPRISKYTMPDTLYTIVSSFQCLDDVITVANYNNLSSFYDVNNTLQNTGVAGGARALSSSIGPTRDGRQKPDIAATGDYVFSAMPIGMQANLVANAPQVVAQGSFHMQGGGTSAASPVVAGLAGLYLQHNPQATSAMVRNAVNYCAYADGHTGPALPDYHWGYGKLDGKAALLCVITGKSELAVANGSASPNPFSESLTLRFKSEVNGTLSAYSSDGRLLCSSAVRGAYHQITKQELGGYTGLVLLRVSDNGQSFSFKVIATD